MNPVEVVDSRRLTGPSLLAERPAAVVDVACSDDLSGSIEATWREEASRMLAAVGWPDEVLASRAFPGGLSLAFTAPIDALFAATEVNDWAIDAAVARVAGEPAPDFEPAAERLRGLIGEEENPALLRLRDAAAARGVRFLSDEDHASVGLGSGARVFFVGDLPAPDAIEWDAIHDVPVALVTGTNGKSTTVRLLASIVSASGRVPGFSSTDGVVVGGAAVREGDYSGPEGARHVLRNEKTEIAILETARGGLLRRGLAVDRADVVVVTNIAEDHLGDFGLGDLATLARIKLVTTRAVESPAHLVFNAEDPILVRHAAELPGPPAWFALDAENASVRAAREAGSAAAWFDGRALWLAEGGTETEVVAVEDVPIALGGAARHNVANALAALLAAARLGRSPEEMAAGLGGFAGSPEENPGRANVFDLGGVKAVVDYAHNPHGYRALFATAAAIPAKRRLVVLGQAGDRPDDAIRELARVAWSAGLDRVVVKEMGTLLRGRERGEVPALIEAELEALDLPAGAVSRAEDEVDAVRQALAWATEGDLLFLLTHEDRPGVLALLSRLHRDGWRPGDPIDDP
ncbi:MAG: Mur ligase family protein [Planctomycetota bacterium]